MNWADFIKQETQQDYFKALSTTIQEDGKTTPIYPPRKDVFNAFKLSINRQKVDD